jgi:hypothetical protein
MAELSKSKGSTGESYARLFGNEQMGNLFSKVQSTIIRTGFELEAILQEIVPVEMQTSLDILGQETQDLSEKPPVQVVFKPSRPDPDNIKKSIQADLLIVNHPRRIFQLVEVKEGYVFDTKKSDGELASLRNITSWLAQEFAFRTQYYLCAFYQEDKQAIVNGTKKRFSIEHVLTGRELCGALGLDYEYILNRRKASQKDNQRYFLNELLRIPEIRAEILDLLGEYDEQ